MGPKTLRFKLPSVGVIKLYRVISDDQKMHKSKSVLLRLLIIDYQRNPKVKLARQVQV